MTSACWLQYGGEIQLRILQHKTSINFGSIYENVAAQELTAHGYTLYYYNSKKFGELDFLIEQEGKIVPIEIKSGKDYYRHNAMDNVLKHAEYGIERSRRVLQRQSRTGWQDDLLTDLYAHVFAEEGTARRGVIR